MYKHKNVVWDIEGNDLLPGLTNIWVLVARDIDTETDYAFSDQDPSLPDMDYACEMLYQTEHHIGHNLFGYDFLAMAKVKGWELRDEQKVTDTWILSLLNKYKRDHNHGLKEWGEKLGSSKIDYNDWSHYNKEMLRYCRQDVNLNVKVYNQLYFEASKLIQRNPMYSDRIKTEMFIARMNMKMQHGWVYDRELADKTIKEITKKMEKVKRKIEPKLGTKRIWIDKAPKTPKYTKKGLYNSVTARLLTEFLGVTVRPEDALLEHPPILPNEHFQRYKEEKITMGQMDDVKTYLMEKEGWKPDEWNRTRGKDGGWRNSSPKLEGPALEALGDIGRGVSEYYMLRHRKSFLEGFNKMSDDRGDGRINGNMWCIGTPTFRVRHEGIVNMPAAGPLDDGGAPYGTEIRSTLTVEPEYSVVGADSAGNQLRGAAHVFQNKEWIDLIVNGGDMHQHNADMVGCTRKMAKVFIYRILFGSTAWGLAREFKIKEAEAQEMIDNFKKGLPEFAKTMEDVEKEWHQNGGFVFGVTGNILFVEEARKAFNAILQDLEKATCSAAMMWSYNKMKEEGIDFYPLIFYHDEDAFAVRSDQAEKAAPIIQEGFREGPKLFGVQIMDGGKPQIGKSYADVH